MSDTFTRTGNLGTDLAAFGRSATATGTAGSTGLADFSGLAGSRTLSAPVIQPSSAIEAGTMFNQVMMTMANHYDPLMTRALMEHPRFYVDRVPKAQFTLFNGATRETRIFRGGLGHYAGLAHWGDMKDWAVTSAGASSTAGMNDQTYPSKYPLPQSYGYSWEKLQWSGKNMAWASDPIDQDVFRFTDNAATQLSWILQAGVEFGLTHQEVWNRDNMIFAAVQNGRGFIMTAGGESAATSQQFFYNPYMYGADAATFLHDKPFILFPADVDVQPLNFDVLDFANDALAVRASNGGGIGSEDGRPVFGMPISMRDFEKFVKGDKNQLEAWRQAMPMELIKGYGMLLKSFRYFALIEDTNQLRFKVAKVVTAAQANAKGITVFGSSATTKLFLAEYVAPRKLGRTGANGIGIPEENMDYIKAELAVFPLFMDKMFTNQFVPDTPALGSGTSFTPFTGLNGNWSFMNIPDKTTNPFGKVGNFYGRFEIVPKPEDNFVNMTAFLYRRCNETLRARCPVNIDEDTGATAAIVSTDVTAAAAGEAILNTLVEIKLSAPIDATVGTPVSIGVLGYDAGAGTAGVIYGHVVGTSGASTYDIAITDLNSVQGSGTSHATDFTSANFPAGGVVTVL